jgi:hypothetical protein
MCYLMIHNLGTVRYKLSCGKTVAKEQNPSELSAYADKSILRID